MRNLRRSRYIFLALVASFVSLALKAQVIDLAGEPAFAPRRGSFTESQIPLSMKFISGDRILIASDLYDRCDDKRDTNVYVILTVDPTTRSVSSSRKIQAPPNSFDLLIDVNHRPLLVSKSSIQILNPQSLDTLQTINFDGLESGTAGGTDEKEQEGCDDINFRTSATPDSRRITVAVPERQSRKTNVYQIDGETLKVTRESIIGYLPNFQTGFEGMYEQTHLRQWDWKKGNALIPICLPCDHMDVLSVNLIVTTSDTRVSVLDGTSKIWSTNFSGMRDSFTSDQKGTRFSLLATTGGRLFDPALRETVFIFDVPQRRARRVQTFSIKQSGPVSGGGRSEIAFSQDGLQLAVFVDGRITVIPHI